MESAHDQKQMFAGLSLSYCSASRSCSFTRNWNHCDRIMQILKPYPRPIRSELCESKHALLPTICDFLSPQSDDDECESLKSTLLRLGM